MLRVYALDRIGKCKRKHTHIACGFVSPFSVMSKYSQLEKYGKSGVMPYVYYSIANRKLQFIMICKIKPGTQLTALATYRLRLRSSQCSEAAGV
jgi:hypothetical protein